MPEDVLISSFDNQIGPIPLVTTLEEQSATNICQHIVMSIMASAKIESDFSIEGESIIPLVEYHKICFTYYFYIQDSNLREPAFSFIAYLADLDTKNTMYANIEGLKGLLSNLKIEFLNSIQIEASIKNLQIPVLIEEKTLSLRKPLKELIGSNFKESKLDIDSETNFIKAVALIFLAENNQINISYAQGIDHQLLQNISLRILLGILSKIDGQDLKNGEGIIPVVENNEMVFCYFFNQPKTQTIGLLLTFSQNRLALYKWAPILSQELKGISNTIDNTNISSMVQKRLQRLYESFEIIAGNQLNKIIESKSLIGKFKENPEIFWKYKNIESIIEALIINKNVFLIDAVTVEEAIAYIQILDNFVPHRDLVLTLEANYQTSQNGQVVVLEKIPNKDFEKSNIIVSLEKKKVLTGKSSNYTKQLVKKLRSFKTFSEIKLAMNAEMEMILNQVDKLVATASLEDSQLIKKSIDELILKLPNKDAFDIIKELTIFYNPILDKFIAEKAVYNLRSDLWNI